MKEVYELEEGMRLAIDFCKIKKIAEQEICVIPAAVQDADTREVLMVCYVNRESLEHSMKHQTAAFWSTTKNQLHEKGKTSGDVLKIVEIRVNCEQNSLLFLVKRAGAGACHTYASRGKHRASCFYRRIAGDRLEMI